jgi:hypothetical protein
MNKKYEKHGMTRTPTKSSHEAMMRRCYDKKFIGYKNYGGRGIKVCKRWHSLSLFIEDMGVKPSLKHSIDRIDNNRDYTPENCRWATRKTQNRNRRLNVKIKYGDFEFCMAEWCEILNLKYMTLVNRIVRSKKPLNVEKILFSKVRYKDPKNQMTKEEFLMKYTPTQRSSK